MIVERKKGINYTKIIAFFLALSPILDPYIITDIVGIDFRLMYLVAIVLIMLLIMAKNKSRNNIELPLLVFYLAIITLVSFLISQGDRDFLIAMKNIVIWAVLSLVVSRLWKSYDYSYFIKWSYYIATFSIIFLLIQFLLLNLGTNNVFNGQIPFLNLSKYDDWSPLHDATGAIRVHSFFQESSYLSIYVLPLFADSLEKNSYKYALFFLIAILISTSSVGIVGVILIVLYHLVKMENKAFSKKLKLFVSILVIGAVVLIVYSINDSFRNVIDFSINKITNIQSDLEEERMGSTKLRLLGHINLFSELPLYFQIIGLGANQYVGYFHLLVSYSNVIVTILLNYGMIGIIFFSCWIISIFIKYKDNRVYTLIFIMICFVDQFWFNWYFFYILTWVFMQRKKLEKGKENGINIGNHTFI